MKRLLTVLFGISLGILISANASALQLINNGGFETGEFSDWLATNVPESGWQINDGTLDPPPPAGDPQMPISGFFDAKTLQIFPGTNTLSQDFQISAGFITSATLSWRDRIENYGPFFENKDPLTRQQFRLDIISNTDIFEIFSTNPGDPTIQLGPTRRTTNLDDIDPNNPNDFFIDVDIASILQPFAGTGQSLSLSFQEIDNIGPFNVTVDDVSLEIEYDAAPVPEPATILLLSSGLIGLAGYVRKRRPHK